MRCVNLSCRSELVLLLFISLFYLEGIFASPLLAPRIQSYGRAVNSSLSLLSLPQNTARNATQLPAPTDGLSLKLITVGRGTQNYSCPSNASSTGPPTSVGALATLYDVTSLLTQFNQSYLNTLTRDAVLTGPTSSNTTNTTSEALTPPLSTAAVVGKHFFDAAGVPSFDLSASDKGFLHGKKLADVTAPASAGKGQVGEKAVDWLALGDAGGSQGVTQVYRVETAGGASPPTCQGLSGQMEVQYAAQYWFYGPA